MLKNGDRKVKTVFPPVTKFNNQQTLGPREGDLCHLGEVLEANHPSVPAHCMDLRFRFPRS